MSMMRRGRQPGVVKGDGGLAIIRSFQLRLEPGSTPGAQINVTAFAANRGYNLPAITDAVNLVGGASSGSYSLTANGLILTLFLDDDVDIIGVLNASITTHDINSSSTTEMYVVDYLVNATNLELSLKKRGGIVAIDLRTILDAGDIADIAVSLITSS